MLITPQGPRYASAAEIETHIRVVVAGREILNIRAGGQSVAKDQASILRDAAFVLVTLLTLVMQQYLAAAGGLQEPPGESN